MAVAHAADCEAADPPLRNRSTARSCLSGRDTFFRGCRCHVLPGLVLVLAMWVTAGLAFRAGAGQGVAAFAALWGVGVVVFGRMQVGLLPGDTHWVISLAHLLAGGVAMGLGTALASAIERSVLRSAPGAAPQAAASGGSSRRPPRPEVS